MLQIDLNTPVNIIKLNLKETIKNLYSQNKSYFENILIKDRVNLLVVGIDKFGGYLNMKIDEYLFNNFDNYFNNCIILRFYQFSNNTITIGKLQKITSDIINQNKNYLIVRRITGGKAVYHLPNKDLTFSLISNLEIFKLIKNTNENILRFIHKFFNNLLKETIIDTININLDSLKFYNLNLKNNLKNKNIHNRFDCFANPMDFELIYNNQKIVGTAIKIDINKFILQANLKLYLIDKIFENYEYLNSKFINVFTQKLSQKLPGNLQKTCH